MAGGAYDYVTNGNMIGGFALIAWPAKYAETGVSTFVVNQAGIVYEKDFGVDTAEHRRRHQDLQSERQLECRRGLRPVPTLRRRAACHRAAGVVI